MYRMDGGGIGNILDILTNG
ncbi:MAG TPA: hypothetical protein EYM32_10235 [Dehalococcoidia bacterium]|nr:hypothetical protein [Dehalococcoidia bacterium]HIM80967.1 hypothetical protein [Dehalococcoidia bacterium]